MTTTEYLNDLVRQYERGLITFDELLASGVALDPSWIESERQRLELVRREAEWACSVCGNQNKDGRVGEFCAYHGKYLPTDEALAATDECPELIAALERFLDDPMTDATGMGGELSSVVARQHIVDHKCGGYRS